MDSGYETFSVYYDCLTKNVNYHQRALYFDGLIQSYLQSDGVVLLDLACGTGSMSEELARLGYDVLGIDYSYGMLSRAMEKKMEHGLPIQYVCQDMRELQLYGTVDVTICTLDSLNHLDCFSEVQLVFQEIYDATEPGGLFLFDMNTVYKHREVLGDRVFVYETEAVYCVWENQYTPEDHTVSMNLEFFTLLINKYVDIVFANEEEAKAFTGKEPEEALRVIAKKCSIAIVKVGASGSYIRKGTEEIKVSAIPVQKVVDTTGAGDYFASGFLYGLTCGYSLDKCAKIGSILSGNVIQVIGTTIPQERWDEIKLNINRILAE